MKKQPPTEYAPPGWFPDPTGLQALRWWDGTQWSHQTRPLPGNEQGPPLPYQPQQSYGQPRQPSSRPDPQYGTPPGQPPYQGHPQYQQTPYEQPYQQAQSYGQQPGPPSGHRGRPARKSWPRRHKVLTVLGSLALILVIVGIASRKDQAGWQCFRRRHYHAHPHDDTDADASRDDSESSARQKPRSPRRQRPRHQRQPPGHPCRPPLNPRRPLTPPRRHLHRPLHPLVAARGPTGGTVMNPANTAVMPTMGRQG